MANTLGRGTDSRQYRRRDAALTRYVELGGSTTLAGAHSKELRLKAELRKLMACYPVSRALRFLESARSFIAGVVRPVTPQRLLEAGAVDRAEDAAETAFLVNPTPTTQETLIRALHAEVAAQSALARDLEAMGRYPDQATVSRLAADHLAALARKVETS